MLHDFAVEACDQGKGARVWYLIAGDEPRTEWAGMAKILTRCELAGVPLPVSNGPIVVAGIACDMFECFVFRNLPATRTDDYGEFPFVIETG